MNQEEEKRCNKNGQSSFTLSVKHIRSDKA